MWWEVGGGWKMGKSGSDEATAGYREEGLMGERTGWICLLGSQAVRVGVLGCCSGGSKTESDCLRVDMRCGCQWIGTLDRLFGVLRGLIDVDAIVGVGALGQVGGRVFCVPCCAVLPMEKNDNDVSWDRV